MQISSKTSKINTQTVLDKKWVDYDVITTGDELFHLKKCYYGLWTGILDRSDKLK